VRIFTLGEPRVFVGTDQIKHWRKLVVRDLLLFLAERRSVSTDQALGALWPDCTEERGKALFREARSRLSTALGAEECVVKDGQRWRLKVEVRVDALEFESLLDAGEQCAQEGDLSSAATAYRQALTLWRGPYLDDLYSEWPAFRREALLRRHQDGLERLGEIELRLRRFDDAIQHFFVLLEVDPTRESGYRGLMRAFALRGEISSALQQYSACERMLRTELGMSPSQETAALAQTLRARARAPRVLRERVAVGT
jgi:DNA-binding SARP family transcriptional activator